MNQLLFFKLFKEKIEKIDKEFENKWVLPEILNSYNEIKTSLNNLNNVTSLEYRRKIQELKVVYTKIIGSYVFDEYFEKVYGLLEYKQMGPISNEFLKLLKSQGIFDLSINDANNTGSSSWGIWKGNKIVLSMSTQKLIFDEQDIESVKKIGVRKTYLISKPLSTYENKKWLYLEDLDNLELNFNKDYYGEIIKLNLKNKRSYLENDSFNKYFNWNKNNEVQFRMIFTPYAQEIYLTEALNNMKYYGEFNVLPEDRLLKIKTFFANEFIYYGKNMLYKETSRIFNEFIDNFYEIDWLIKNYKELVFNVVYNEFKGIKYLYLLPFFESVDNKTIINKALKIKRNTQKWDVFYIINNIIRKTLFTIDTNEFYILDNQKMINDITIANVIIHTYEWNSSSSVNPYWPKEKNMKISYCLIDNKDIFFRPLDFGQYVEKPKDIDLNVLKVIQLALKENIEIYIQDGFIVAKQKNLNIFIDDIKLVGYVKLIQKHYLK